MNTFHVIRNKDLRWINATSHQGSSSTLGNNTNYLHSYNWLWLSVYLSLESLLHNSALTNGCAYICLGMKSLACTLGPSICPGRAWSSSFIIELFLDCDCCLSLSIWNAIVGCSKCGIYPYADCHVRWKREHWTRWSLSNRRQTKRRQIHCWYQYWLLRRCGIPNHAELAWAGGRLGCQFFAFSLIVGLHISSVEFFRELGIGTDMLPCPVSSEFITR